MGDFSCVGGGILSKNCYKTPTFQKETLLFEISISDQGLARYYTTAIHPVIIMRSNQIKYNCKKECPIPSHTSNPLMYIFGWPKCNLNRLMCRWISL